MTTATFYSRERRTYFFGVVCAWRNLCFWLWHVTCHKSGSQPRRLFASNYAILHSKSKFLALTLRYLPILLWFLIFYGIVKIFSFFTHSSLVIFARLAVSTITHRHLFLVMCKEYAVVLVSPWNPFPSTLFHPVPRSETQSMSVDNHFLV